MARVPAGAAGGVVVVAAAAASIGDAAPTQRVVGATALASALVLLLSTALACRVPTLAPAVGPAALRRAHVTTGYLACALTISYLVPAMLLDGGIGISLPWHGDAQSRLALPHLLAVTLLALGSRYRQDLHRSRREWLILHRLLAVAVLLTASAHLWFVGGRVGLPAVSWSGVMAFGLASGVMWWRYAALPGRMRRQSFTVVSVSDPDDRGRVEVLIQGSARSGSVDMLHAGDLVWVATSASRFADTQAARVASSQPAERRARLTLRSSGPVLAAMGPSAGRRLYLDGPYRGKDARDNAQVVVLVSSLSNLRSAMDLLRSCVAAADPREFLLVVGAQQREDVEPAVDELLRLRDTLRLDVAITLLDPPPGWGGHIGPLDADLVLDLAAVYPPDQLELYVAGPSALVDDVFWAFERLGLPADRFHVDSRTL